MLQSFNYLCGNLLDCLWYFHFFCNGKPRTGQNSPCVHFFMCGITCAEQRRGIISSYLLATSQPPNSVQDNNSLLCSKGTLTAHVQPFVLQDPQALFSQTAFQLGGPQHILLPMAVPAQVQNFPIPLVELHEVSVSKFFSLAESLWTAVWPSGISATPSKPLVYIGVQKFSEVVED